MAAIAGGIAALAMLLAPYAIDAARRPHRHRSSSELATIMRLPPRNPNFTGRAEMLDQVWRSLTSSTTSAVHTLHGTGGVGKSQLAVEYAHRHTGDYRLVAWIDAHDSRLIPDYMAALAPHLNLPSDEDVSATAVAVRDALAAQIDWLLVFDDAEQPGDLRNWLPAKGGHVLITSRSSGWAALGTTTLVDVMTRKESTSLLNRRVPNLDGQTADAIARLLDDLPLALEQAAGYIDQTGTPAVSYVSMLQDRMADMLSRGQAVGHDSTVASLWTLSRHRLAADHQTAAQLLDICAYLDSADIPYDLFAQSEADLPHPLADTVADQLLLNEAFGALHAFGLAQRRARGVSIHSLLGAAIRLGHSAAEREGLVRTGVDLLNAKVAKLAPVDRLSDVAMFVHASALARHGVPDEGDQRSTEHTVERTNVFLRALGLPEQSSATIGSSLRLIEEVKSGKDIPDIVIDGNELFAPENLSPEDRGLRLYQEMAQALEETYGPDHPLVVREQICVAQALTELGRIPEARALYERAINVLENEYGPGHVSLVAPLNNLAVIFRDAGRVADARALFHRGLAIGENVWGAEEPVVQMIRNHIKDLNDHQPPESCPLPPTPPVP